MSENLKIYDAVKEVPEKAKKPITGGRMSGKTDINPMWRIKALTEQFGPCGFGWKYEIVKSWLENGCDGEIAAFVEINLFIKWNGEWSDAIPGTGGNTFVAKEKSGLKMSDECFKMALTDAISVSCKALGVGALVYWASDKTKYDNLEPFEHQPQKALTSQPQKAPTLPPKQPSEEPKPHCKTCNSEISIKEHDFSVTKFHVPLCRKCQATHKKAAG